MDAKPCPFCGSVGVVVREGSTPLWVVARCYSCWAQGPESSVGNVDADTQAGAIAAWNDRAPEKPEGGE